MAKRRLTKDDKQLDLLREAAAAAPTAISIAARHKRYLAPVLRPRQ
jgi:hypothetical protein